MKDIASELGHRPRKSVCYRINVFLAGASALGIVILLLYQSLPWLGEKAQQDAIVKQKEAELDKARMDHRRLEREVQLLQSNDPEYLGLFVRDRLTQGYMKPGETIFRFDSRAAQ